MKLYLFLLGVFCLQSSCLMKDKTFNSAQLTNKTSYLYITNTKQIDNLDTITYFYSHSVPSQDIQKIFMSFSKKIGSHHGFMVISPNINIDLAYELTKQISNCNIMEPTLWPSLVFEDIKKKECFSFQYADINEGKILQTFLMILERIEGQGDLRKESFRFNLKEDLIKLIKNTPQLRPLERTFMNFIDYISEAAYDRW